MDISSEKELQTLLGIACRIAAIADDAQSFHCHIFYRVNNANARTIGHCQRLIQWFTDDDIVGAWIYAGDNGKLSSRDNNTGIVPLTGGIHAQLEHVSNLEPRGIWHVEFVIPLYHVAGRVDKRPCRTIVAK
ncbi:hypothetical protein D3C71_1673300 [compost metagenome]